MIFTKKNHIEFLYNSMVPTPTTNRRANTPRSRSTRSTGSTKSTGSTRNEDVERVDGPEEPGIQVKTERLDNVSPLALNSGLFHMNLPKDLIVEFEPSEEKRSIKRVRIDGIRFDIIKNDSVWEAVARATGLIAPDGASVPELDGILQSYVQMPDPRTPKDLIDVLGRVGIDHVVVFSSRDYDTQMEVYVDDSDEDDLLDRPIRFLWIRSNHIYTCAPVITAKYVYDHFRR